MAAHEEAEQQSERKAKTGPSAAEIRSQVVGLLAGIVRWVGLIFAVVLVVYVILTLGGANPSNGITEFIKSFADAVSLGFKDLFTPSEPKLRVLVNYGVAAIFWLIVSYLVAALIRRLA
ncbi:MAG: hypothetical protein ACRDRL_05000 [Sciscionella sp.]